MGSHETLACPKCGCECDRARAKKNYHGKYHKYYLDKNTEAVKVKRKWLEDYKKDRQCGRCGDSRWYVLDFHHRDNTDKISEVTTMAVNNYSIENIQKEIDKCDLICANCHREIHYLMRI